jgi:hypothetical protein
MRMTTDGPPIPSKFSSAPRVIGFIFLALFIGAMLVFLITEWNSADFRQLLLDHFRAIVGLPAAGIFAFLVVATFESTSGQIEFEAIGLKFKGAAGPLLMWVITFLSIVLAIHLLW